VSYTILAPSAGTDVFNSWTFGTRGDPPHTERRRVSDQADPTHWSGRCDRYDRAQFGHRLAKPVMHSKYRNSVRRPMPHWLSIVWTVVASNLCSRNSRNAVSSIEAWLVVGRRPAREPGLGPGSESGGGGCLLATGAETSQLQL